MIPKLRSDPIIVIGADSSGTTMLVRILEKCQVFMGGELASNYWGEPTIFPKHINVFTDGFRFHLPIPANWKSHVEAQRSAILDFCRIELPVLYRNAGYSGGKWGFKDPRNVFTTGIFLEQYPQAVVFHIVRDGLDVAESRLGVRGFHRESFDEWVAWWHQTVSIARTYRELGCRYLEVKYEDICYHNTDALEKISAVSNCELSHAEKVVGQLASPTRIGKWRTRDRAISKTALRLRESIGYS
jgi:hypothetical protein